MEAFTYTWKALSTRGSFYCHSNSYIRAPAHLRTVPKATCVVEDGGLSVDIDMMSSNHQTKLAISIAVYTIY